MNEFDFEKITSAKSSKEAWDILKKAYKGDDQVKQVQLQTLRGELESITMKETEGVVKYVTQIETMVNQLSRNGETLPTSRVLEKILRSLIENFENMVCTIEQFKDLLVLTIKACRVSWGAWATKIKKKWEPLEKLLQMKGEAQNTQGRGRYWGGRESCTGGRSRGQKEEKERSNQQNMMEEYEVHGKEASWAIQMLSALSVKSIAIIQRSSTYISASIVSRLNSFAKNCRFDEIEETTNLTKEVEEEEEVLLMMVHSLGVEPKQLNNLITQSSNMENSTIQPCSVENSTTQSSSVDRSARQPSRLERSLTYADSPTMW